MNLATLGALLAYVAAAALLEQLIVRIAKAVMLAATPLSGEHTDSFLYERSIWTPGEKDLIPLWLALAAAGGLAWAAWSFDLGWLSGLAALAWLAAIGWDLWTWERVAASVKFVTWRRGWQQSARRVPVSHLAEVHVHEKAMFGPFGACYLALETDDGKAVKLPRTGVPGGLGKVENVANFVRLQMQQVEDLRHRVANERKRAGKPPIDPSERELRERLKALRQARVPDAEPR
ncbi:hypothetical protein M8A51_06995 [Schlegelella sp. S2-27]|uniref:PH domain-containing protein n=1 Tax=Caldimonas mangrovi TaxID=2944811 RepID=A0ABT0YM90_9BURK|nr:hypothetical protein [Caldimonas mangrovi]MCM5679276.1 hypothetical protein [Caldimonas mangrovi]